MRTRQTILLAIWCASISVSVAQEEARSGIIFGEVPSHAAILLNDSLINPAAGDTVFLTPGTHLIDRVVGNRHRWTIHRFVDTVVIRSGEFMRARTTTASEHLITSRPTGSDVFRNGTILGRTPFRFVHDEPSEGILSVRKEGYEARVFTLAGHHEHILLSPSSGVEPVPLPAVQGLQPTMKNRTLTIVSAVAMIGSSVAAAYLKERANIALDEYERTKDPGALDKVRRYDKYSGIAAATMVVSFSGFAAFLMLE
jgi:hypothetical protein